MKKSFLRFPWHSFCRPTHDWLHFCRHFFAALMIAASTMAVADTPWHLGGVSLDDPGVEIAPAAIAKKKLVPGPHPVVVAVVDVGVWGEHPSIAGRLLPGFSIVKSDRFESSHVLSYSTTSDPEKDVGDCAAERHDRHHGTAVSSLIAGNGYEGVLGVNPSAYILPIKLLSLCGNTKIGLEEAIAWAAGMQVSNFPLNQTPAKIINLSLSGIADKCPSHLARLFEILKNRGIFVVVAAGNKDGAAMSEPANCPHVISVGAVGADNQVEGYSAVDAGITLYAPGGGRQLHGSHEWSANRLPVAGIQSRFWGSDQPSVSVDGLGTSYAAPVVSGFLSLWLSYRPDLTHEQFHAELPRYLRPVRPPHGCPRCRPKSLANIDALMIRSIASR